MVYQPHEIRESFAFKPDMSQQDEEHITPSCISNARYKKIREIKYFFSTRLKAKRIPVIIGITMRIPALTFVFLTLESVYVYI